MAGYNVYVRLAGTPYGAPRDARLLRPGADGTISFTALGLLPDRTYYVALTSYSADRTESPMSQELALGSIDPCTIDTCTSPKDCIVGALPDGIACSDLDLCSACQQGVCTAGTTLPAQVDRIRLQAGGRVSRVSFRATFPAPRPFDPTLSEIGITVGEATRGVVLYRGQVPGNGLQDTFRGRVYRYRTWEPGSPERLAIRLAVLDDVVVLKVRASVPDLTPYMPLNQVGVAIRVGPDDCWQRPDLVCSGSLSSAICR